MTSLIHFVGTGSMLLHCTLHFLCAGRPADTTRHRSRDSEGHLWRPDGGGGAGQRHEGARVGRIRGRHLQGKGRIHTPSLNSPQRERKGSASSLSHRPAPWTHIYMLSCTCSDVKTKKIYIFKGMPHSPPHTFATNHCKAYN